MPSQIRDASPSTSSAPKYERNGQHAIDWDALGEIVLQDCEDGSRQGHITYDAGYDYLSPGSPRTLVDDSSSVFHIGGALDLPLPADTLPFSGLPEWRASAEVVSSFAGDHEVAFTRLENAGCSESVFSESSNELGDVLQDHWGMYTDDEGPLMPFPMDHLDATADSELFPAMSRYPRTPSPPPVIPEDISGSSMTSTPPSSPNLTFNDQKNWSPPCAKEESPAPRSEDVLAETQSAAGLLMLPAAFVSTERTGKRKRDEQENEAVVRPTVPVRRREAKGKLKATLTKPLSADAGGSREGAADSGGAVVEPEASTSMTAAGLTLRRSKRRKVEATSPHSRPSTSTPVASTSNVPEMTSASSPSPSPAPSPAPSASTLDSDPTLVHAPASPTPPVEHIGLVCGLLNEDGTRCYHPLTMVMSQDKDHVNSHKRASPEDRGFRCTYPGCDKSEVQYSTKCNRNKHIFEHHWNYRFPCDVPGCTKDFGREDEIPRHKRTAHR
ncbi:hypothetical protein ONZ51_g6068 [Trametes cubensis]|uniref:C2H2-type domain-containing protein n=1 Tax=Trametes cubensis TaxID=1111947 RepID=A0AAD7TV90_9APHY|nr:hypothetical protein ONZ51_g6068 [Trametes cubensis]